MGTLTDDDLRHLLGEAAAAYDVPEDGCDEVLDEAVVVPLHRRRRVQLPAAAAAVVLALLAGTALFGGDDVDRVGQLAGAPRSPVAVSADGKGARADDQLLRQSGGETEALTSSRDTSFTAATGGTTGTAGSADASVKAAPGFAPQFAAPAPVAALAPGAAGAPAAPVAADGARIVKTGAIALVVDDERVTPVLTEVQALATAVGGVVADAKTQELGATPAGSVTLRVPVARFEEVVAKVRALDAEVSSASTSGQDVTASYADIEAQIRTLTAARERFLEILSRARTIGDVLAVQQRVDDVTGKLDRLEGQRRVLADQSDKATLQVSVTEEADAVRTKAEPDTGLSKAFSDAWTGFTSGVEGLVRLSGRGVLLVLCLGIAWIVLRLGWRASRRRLV